MPLELNSVYVTAAIELLAMIVHATVIAGVLLTRRRDPSATLAWILFIVLAPVVGAVTYLAVGRTRMRRSVKRAGRAEAQLRDVLSPYRTRTQEFGESLPEPRTAAQIRLGNALASTTASWGNSARVLNDAATTYGEMIAAIDQARDHVHVEFYIIQPDVVGTTLREHLVRKAAEGVEVRLLCDAIGSVALPPGFWEPLRAAGGHAATFAPLTRLVPRLRRRDRIDFRNHRKIVVVDGRVGFTGGINVGREYLGLDPDIGRWRDAHVRIEGPAVVNLQQAFVQDWLMTTGETLEASRFFAFGQPPAGNSLVQVIDSGPDQTWPSMELYHAQAIALAQDRVYITNPYFIPSQTIEAVLTQAALRGVDVRLLLPRKSDSRLVTWASRSYYAVLLQAGVRIYEYERGFMHAKTMVVDEWVATIGSANMDMRSFNLNFELNAFMFDATLCRDMAHRFGLDLGLAAEVTAESERRAGVLLRLVRAIARLLSPLL